MKQLSGKAFARLLGKRGWELKRIKGSHHIYMKEGNPARISVPIWGFQTKTGMNTNRMRNPRPTRAGLASE